MAKKKTSADHIVLFGAGVAATVLLGYLGISYKYFNDTPVGCMDGYVAAVRFGLQSSDGLPLSMIELQAQAGLSDEQIDWLWLNFRDHPGRPITDKARIPNCKIRGGFIGGAPPVVPKKSIPQYDLTYMALDEGHWPMITAVDKLAEIMNTLIHHEARQSRGGDVETRAAD